jgi:hypothetical protein
VSRKEALRKICDLVAIMSMHEDCHCIAVNLVTCAGYLSAVWDGLDKSCVHSFGGRPFGRSRFGKSGRPQYDFQIDLKDIK